MYDQTAYNKRYYGRTSNRPNNYKRWEQWEIDLILDKPCCDSDLSDILQRSMKSIVVKRSVVLKQMEKDNKKDDTNPLKVSLSNLYGKSCY